MWRSESGRIRKRSVRNIVETNFESTTSIKFYRDFFKQRFGYQQPTGNRHLPGDATGPWSLLQARTCHKLWFIRQIENWKQKEYN